MLPSPTLSGHASTTTGDKTVHTPQTEIDKSIEDEEDVENDLFAISIDVDADNYATAATHQSLPNGDGSDEDGDEDAGVIKSNTNKQDRTFQSVEAFRRERDGYRAVVDGWGLGGGAGDEEGVESERNGLGGRATTGMGEQKDGGLLSRLFDTVPILAVGGPLVSNTPQRQNGPDHGDTADAHDEEDRVKLSKRDGQLLGYVVGELYFDNKFKEVVDLCTRVRGRCVVDQRLGASLEKWRRRCEERMLEGRAGR